MRKTLLPHMPTLLMISDTDCQTQSGSTLGNVFSQLPYNSFFNKLHHQFRSVPWPTGLSGGTWGTIQQRSSSSPFCRRPLWAVSGTGRDVHSLILSIQHFLCRPWHCPTSNVPWRMVLEMLSWRVTCLNHASFHLLTVARRASCGLPRELILLCTQWLLMCSK